MARNQGAAGEARRRATAAARRPTLPEPRPEDHQPPAPVSWRPPSGSPFEGASPAWLAAHAARTVHELETLAATMAVLDAQRAALVERRDALVDEALDTGHPVGALAAASGVSRQALAKRRGVTV